MRIKFWGVRGSLPVPGPDTIEVGGNTSCIEIRNSLDELLIIDAGTGIKKLGEQLALEYHSDKLKECHLLLSHTHWDHIQGLPFFLPFYFKDFHVTIYGPVRRNENLKNILSGQMNYPYYPVNISDLKAKIDFVDLDEQHFQIGSFSILPKVLNHPVKTYGYRIESEGKILTTLFDHEVYRCLIKDVPTLAEELKIHPGKLEEAESMVDSLNQAVISFIKKSDVVIYDAHFSRQEYERGRHGWGHGPTEAVLEKLKSGDVGKLLLFHHAPEKTDADLIKMAQELENFRKSIHLDLNLVLAKENCVITI